MTRPAYHSSSCTQCTSTRRPTSAAPTERFAPIPLLMLAPPPPPPPPYPGPPPPNPGLPPLKSGPPPAPGLLRGSPAPLPWPGVPAVLPGTGGAAAAPGWPLRPRPLPRPLPLPLPVDAAAPLCGVTRLGVTHASVQHLDPWRSHTAGTQQACYYTPQASSLAAAAAPLGHVARTAAPAPAALRRLLRGGLAAAAVAIPAASMEVWNWP